MIEINSLYLIKSIRDNPNITFYKNLKLLSNSSNSSKSTLINGLAAVILDGITATGLYYCYRYDSKNRVDKLSLASNWYGNIVCIMDVETKDIFLYRKEKLNMLSVSHLYVFNPDDDIDVLYHTLEYGITKTKLMEKEYDIIFN